MRGSSTSDACTKGDGRTVPVCVPVILHTRVVSGPGGGPDKTILNSPRYLTTHGYHALCAYLHPPGDPGFEQLRAKARQWQAPLLSVPDRGPWDWAVLEQLLRICRTHRVTIWHGHDYKSNAVGLVLRRFWPMRLVTTVHGWVKFTPRTPLYYGIDRLCLRRYERVICVSEDLRRQCLACGVPTKRCLLVENAIDTDQYARRLDVAAAKQGLGIPSGRLLVGAVGRLSEEKGFDLLIRAVDELIRQGLDLELWIVGEGDQQPRLQALITQLGRQDRIRLLGYRSDTAELYEVMDAFALSSLREGLPNVVLEALAMEVPVVATRVAGVPQVIRDGENGLLVEPRAADELAEALRKLLTQPELRARLAAAGRQTIEQHHSFAVRMQKILAIYDDLLQPSRGGRVQNCALAADAP